MVHEEAPVHARGRTRRGLTAHENRTSIELDLGPGLRRWRFTLLASLLFVSCRSESIVLSDWPNDLPYAAVLFLDSEGIVLSGTPILDGTSPLVFEPEEGSLSRARELVVFGFDESTLAKADPPTDDSVLKSAPLRARGLGEASLPTPVRVGLSKWGTELESGTLTITDHRAPSLALTADWLPSCPRNACDLLPFGDPIPIEVPMEEASIFAVARADPDTALVLTSRGEAFAVNGEGAIPMTGLSTSAAYLAATNGPNGEIWALLPRKLVEVSLPDQLIARAEVRAEIFEDKIAAGPGPRTEVFVVSASGTVDRYNGSSVQELYTSPMPELTATNCGITATEETRSVATLQDLGVIVRSEGSMARVDTSLPSPVAAVYTREIGLVVATDPSVAGESGLYQERDGGWRILPGSENAGIYINLWPTEHGLFGGGDLGVLLYYDARLDSICPGRRFATFNIFAIVELESGFIIAGGRRGLSSPVDSLVLFAPRIERDVPPSCSNYP